MATTKIERIGNREFRLIQDFDANVHSVVSQPINAKTGKAWQATTYILRSRDCKNGLHALAVFNKAVSKAREA